MEQRPNEGAPANRRSAFQFMSHWCYNGVGFRGRARPAAVAELGRQARAFRDPVSIAQKLLMLSPLVAALVLTGCTTFSGRHFGVQQKGPHEHMFVSSAGHKEWYSALELENEARRYVKEKKVQFDFEATEMNIWVVTDGSPGLARVSFSSAMGKLSLIVDINRHGRAYNHFLGMSVCGFGEK